MLTVEQRKELYQEACKAIHGGYLRERTVGMCYLLDQIVSARLWEDTCDPYYMHIDLPELWAQRPDKLWNKVCGIWFPWHADAPRIECLNKAIELCNQQILSQCST